MRPSFMFILKAHHASKALHALIMVGDAARFDGR